MWLLLSSVNLQAAVSLSGTRLIFDGRFQEASLEVTNRSGREVLIQAWLSDPGNVDGDPDISDASLPFALSAPLSRLDPGARQKIRILYQGEGMPQDSESLLHLYVLEIPRRVDGANQLSIAIRQRLNLFYRPPGLPGDPAGTAYRLRWTLARRGAGQASLRVTNPTLFHAAIQDVRLGGVAINESLLLAPGASHDMHVASGKAGQRLSFQTLTDYGAPRSYCAQGNGDGFLTTEYRQKDC
jgi:P pilus assembly chaperone PapD